MKVLSVLFFAVASFGLLGCPEQAKPEPSQAAAPAKSGVPAAAPETSAKAADTGGGW